RARRNSSAARARRMAAHPYPPAPVLEPLGSRTSTARPMMPGMMRGEGTAVVPGVTVQEVFDFVIDPAQYRLADTKIVRVTKIGDRPDGMVAREDGKFMGRLPGTVVNGYRWDPPRRLDITQEFGFPRS